jgi:hypothetical protein
MSRTLCMLGVVFAVLIVWGGDYAMSHVQKRHYDFEEEFVPRAVQTAFTAAPFLLMTLFLNRELRARKDPPEGLCSRRMSENQSNRNIRRGGSPGDR